MSHNRRGWRNSGGRRGAARNKIIFFVPFVDFVLFMGVTRSS